MTLYISEWGIMSTIELWNKSCVWCGDGAMLANKEKVTIASVKSIQSTDLCVCVCVSALAFSNQILFLLVRKKKRYKTLKNCRDAKAPNIKKNIHTEKILFIGIYLVWFFYLLLWMRCIFLTQTTTSLPLWFDSKKRNVPGSEKPITLKTQSLSLCLLALGMLFPC